MPPRTSPQSATAGIEQAVSSLQRLVRTSPELAAALRAGPNQALRGIRGPVSELLAPLKRLARSDLDAVLQGALASASATSAAHASAIEKLRERVARDPQFARQLSLAPEAAALAANWLSGEERAAILRFGFGGVLGGLLVQVSDWAAQSINLVGGMTPDEDIQAVGVPFVWVSDSGGGELQQHFTYRDSFGTIWDSWYDATYQNWSLQQVNGAAGITGGPPAASDPFANPYYDYYGVPQQHIAYRDAASIIWDCWFDGGQWKRQQINAGATAMVPSAPPSAGSPFIWVYATSTLVEVSGGSYMPVKEQHFTYRSTLNSTIWDAWFDGDQWHPQLIDTGGVSTVVDPFVCVFYRQKHIGYRDADGIIWSTWYDESGDVYIQQINGPFGLVPSPSFPNNSNWPAVGNVYIGVYCQQLHFTYRAADGTIWDSFYDAPTDTSYLQQLNSPAAVVNPGRTGGPAAVSDPFVSVFPSYDSKSATSYTLQAHIAYRDSDATIWDIWYDGNGNWQSQQIPSQVIGAADLTPNSGPSIPT